MSLASDPEKTILYVAHYDPSTDLNGAKMRLLAMARIIERSGYRFVYLQSGDKSVYRLDSSGLFTCRGTFSDGTFFSSRNVICVIFSWFWIFRYSDGILSHLRLSNPRPPIVLDTIDAVGIRQYREYLSTATQTPTASFSLQEEIDQVNRADWIIAITEEEREYFAAMTHFPVSVISYSEDEAPTAQKIRHDHSALDGRANYITGFFGSRNYANYHSAIRSAHVAWMSGRVMQFHLAGSVCDYGDLAARLRARYGPWLNVLGRVDTPHDFYKSLDFTTNMLAFGSGIKIKVVESLTYGVPTICNYVAVEGLTRYERMRIGIWRAETALDYRELLEGPLVSEVMKRVGVSTAGLIQRSRFGEEIRQFLMRIDR